MTYWIIPWKDTYFDLENCLKKYHYVEWREVNNLAIGDIVFLYRATPIKEIQYKLKVTKINIPADKVTDDDEFVIDPWDPKPAKSYARLEPVQDAVVSHPGLSYQSLVNHGLTSKLQMGVRVTDGLLAHIRSCFNDTFCAETQSYTEGAASEVTSTSYERNPQARAKCLSKFGYKCQICGFDFEQKYGPLGRHFIHVHHITFISEQGGTSHKVNPIKDLIPVCPNCHAMLHHKTVDGEYLTPIQLKELISNTAIR